MQGADITSARLRREVGMLRARETRRRFDVMVSVGRPAGGRDSFVIRAQDLPAVDAALRADVIASLVEHSDPDWDCAWLTRPGDPEPHDLDLQWLAAATVGFAMHGRRLAGFYAITRSGWLDLRTGESRVWTRLRL